mmetsp:Transcript_8322/g.12936  ORF Transcript_8322/g.12936 Transcript_8322/m.12936 type:complete len:429 (+) Transcript_8322:76-1362(+)
MLKLFLLAFGVLVLLNIIFLFLSLGLEVVNNMSIDALNVVKISYPKNAASERNKYDAAGVLELHFDANDKRLKDKCAFSQYLLSECDSVSALVISNRKPASINNAHATGNEWQFLCEKEHLFDTEYAKQWLELKGVEHIHCPLCKTGVDFLEQKDHIEEHDIDSMEQLKERRQEAVKENDEYLVYHIDQLILDKAATELWRGANAHRNDLNRDALQSTLDHWTVKRKMDEFRPKIVESTKKCIEKDNRKILECVCYRCNYKNSKDSDRNHEMLDFISHAARFGAFDCIQLLLKQAHTLDWAAEQRPTCLLNAVKYHPENVEMVNLILDKLQALKLAFVCDDVMEQVIKFDLVDIAKRIVNNRWHKISQKDETLAKQINLQMHSYFCSRNAAFNYNAFDDGEQLDLDAWEDDDDNAAETFDDDADDTWE